MKKNPICRADHPFPIFYSPIRKIERRQRGVVGVVHFLTFRFNDLKICEDQTGKSENLISARVSRFLSNCMWRAAKNVQGNSKQNV